MNSMDMSMLKFSENNIHNQKLVKYTLELYKAIQIFRAYFPNKQFVR